MEQIFECLTWRITFTLTSSVKTRDVILMSCLILIVVLTIGGLHHTWPIRFQKMQLLCQKATRVILALFLVYSKRSASQLTVASLKDVLDLSTKGEPRKLLKQCKRL